MDSVIAVFVAALIAANMLASVIAVYYAGCAIAAMGRETHTILRHAFWTMALGYVAQILAAVDFLFLSSLTWPWFFLAGVLVANGATAVVYLANRRHCSCPACPARRFGREEG